MTYTYEHPHPAVAADVALFRESAGRTQLLLIRRAHDPFAGCWALPGGFVDIDEDLETAARRELGEETGLGAGDLVQLQTFGRPGRDPRERVISVVFIGMAEEDQPNAPQAGDDAAAASWFGITELPPLAFDHAEIIGLARQRLMTLAALAGR